MFYARKFNRRAPNIVMSTLASMLLSVVVSASAAEPQFPLEPGWYSFYDQSILPMRCLCDSGFLARNTDHGTVVVVSAPKGFEATVGKEFLPGPITCPECRPSR